MRNQKIKKVLALCLTLCLAVGIAPVSFAAQPNESGMIAPYAAYIRDEDCALKISGKTATVTASVTGQTGIATKCKVTAMLQRELSSGSWVTVKSWTDQQDSRKASVSETYSVISGETYRVKATVTVWAGEQSESMTIYSDSKTA